MSNPELLRCPNCAAPLKRGTVRCGYCDAEFTAPVGGAAAVEPPARREGLPQKLAAALLADLKRHNSDVLRQAGNLDEAMASLSEEIAEARTLSRKRVEEEHHHVFEYELRSKLWPP